MELWLRAVFLGADGFRNWVVLALGVLAGFTTTNFKRRHGLTFAGSLARNITYLSTDIIYDKYCNMSENASGLVCVNQISCC